MTSKREYEEMVKGPGKYEGEAAYVPYLHEEGDVSEEAILEDAGEWVGIYEIWPEDVTRFPELHEDSSIALYEDSQGFVTEITLKSARATMKDWYQGGYDENPGWSEYTLHARLKKHTKTSWHVVDKKTRDHLGLVSKLSSGRWEGVQYDSVLSKDRSYIFSTRNDAANFVVFGE